MSRPKKFEPGEPFTSFDDLVEWCRRGADGYVFWIGSRPVHGSWMLSQMMSTILHHLETQKIRRAIVRREWIAKQLGVPLNDQH